MRPLPEMFSTSTGASGWAPKVNSSMTEQVGPNLDGGDDTGQPRTRPGHPMCRPGPGYGLGFGKGVEKPGNPCKKIFHLLSANIAEFLKVKASSILLVNEQKGTLELAASYGLSEKYLDRGPLSLERSVAEALEGKPVVIKDATTDDRVQYRKEKQEEGIVSMLSVPIKAKEKVIGVLRLYSAAPRDFTEDEIMLVSALAYQGGLTIQNASMYLMLERDINEPRGDIWSHR